MNQIKRVSIAGLLALASFGVSAMALAETNDAKAQCDGKKDGGHAKGERFKKSDANKDGALTKAEVGDKRWERIKLADANNDGKVTKAEMDQARKDGKMPKGRGKPGAKA